MQQHHLTDQQVLDYRARSLAPRELLRVDDHLSICSTCRDRLWNEMETGPMIASLRNLADAATDPTVHKRKRLWTAVAAIAAVLIATVALVIVMRTPSTPVLKTATVSSTPAPIAPIPPTPATPQMPDEYQTLLERTRREGKFDRAPVLRDLIRKDSVLLAPGRTDESHAVRGPIGTVVLSDKPAFRWQPVAAATQYVVAVFDSNFEKVMESPALTTAEWIPSKALPRGKTYSWQVTATVDGAAVRFPKPPAAEAVFRVIDSSRFTELSRTKQEYPDSHVLLAALYAKEGLLDDSEAELKLADPTEARPLLESLRQIRSSTTH